MDDTNESRAPSEPREVSVEPPSRHTLSSYRRYATVHVSGERVARLLATCLTTFRNARVSISFPEMRIFHHFLFQS